MKKTGAELVRHALEQLGIRHTFGIPGVHNTEIYDQLARSSVVTPIRVNHEGGAAYMADAYAKLTGQPGIVMVTRGPGASNASVGVHTAFQDASPMVVLIGQVGNDFMEREAFQEVDYRRMYGPLTKWVAQIDRTDRIPEMVSHAFHTAMAGRPGPVVLALPQDMLYETADVVDVPHFTTVRPSPAAAEMQAMQRLLQSAERRQRLGRVVLAPAGKRREIDGLELPLRRRRGAGCDKE